MHSRAARTVGMVFCLTGLAFATGDKGVWLDVPFVKQSKDGCGAASIAMVMRYWERQQGVAYNDGSDPEQILRALYSGNAHGIYASKMQQYLQAHRFRAFVFQGEWTDLKQHLEKGRPLIVALRPSSIVASLHYVVVAGVDPVENVVMVNDPAQRKLLKQDRISFEGEWNATKKWTLLAVPQSDTH